MGTKSVAGGLILLCSLLSHGKVGFNSYCYFNSDKDRNAAQIAGSADKSEPFEIASVSKVITSYWALEKLGPLYRFPTKIYISNQRGEEADVHLEGSLDPYLGQEAMYFIISELHKAGVHRIRDLSFDEYFKVLWEVREYDYGVPQNRGFIPSADRVQNTLREVFDDGKINMENYSNVRRKAFQIRKIQMVEHPSVMARNVIFRSRVDFQTLSSASHTVPTIILQYQSAYLYEYLKEMNRLSHNFVAEMIFAAVSKVDVKNRTTAEIKALASKAFLDFVTQTLKTSSNSIRFINGSGDSEGPDDPRAPRDYNEASCETVIRILFRTSEILKKNNLKLEDVLAVSGVDHSTLGSRYSAYPGVVTAKTGSVNPAITLAGLIHTKNGPIFFAVLASTDSPAEWHTARNKIREKVVSIMSENGGGQSVPYVAQAFLPFYSVVPGAPRTSPATPSPLASSPDRNIKNLPNKG